jgi:hypothetical protein
MAPKLMSFEAFHRTCLTACGERDPPDEANCSICTEEYDRAEHQAMRVHVALPMPCYHKFCRECLTSLFARQKIQGGVNLCPLCRAPWFKAEYESPQAQARRQAEQAANTVRPSASTANPFFGPTFASSANPFLSSSRTSTYSNQTTTSTTQTFGDAPQPPPQRAPRPYARTGRAQAGAARSPT